MAQGKLAMNEGPQLSQFVTTSPVLTCGCQLWKRGSQLFQHVFPGTVWQSGRQLWKMGVQYPRISHPQCLSGPVETSHERGRHSFPGLALYNLSVFVEPNQGREELSIPDLNSQGLNRPPEASPE